MKRAPRNANFSVAPMLVGFPVAVVHMVWKTRIGETNILRNGILA